MPTPTISLRPALETDCSSLAALSIEVWLNSYIREGISSFFADYALAEFTADKFRRILSQPSELLLVSQNCIGIDGFIRVRVGQKSPAGSHSETEIATLYVQPRHQGKGIGLCLLRAALDHCQSSHWAPPWLAVNSENTKAITFYQRHGFTPVGQTHFKIQDTNYLNEVLQYDP
ncbi:N-acetyltransferase [Parasedimentitalea marina]|uniref:N-acetyltransferase n=1 Tax=Parasedimentitalea marina TaxID=2483033 RepID=A0A3T0MYM0_9RHOB|nr:N-acetyltransferase [Parasedimentitalea marina]AZV76868.1 N-acetyltransferase [Parasedimentitalea marina]